MKKNLLLLLPVLISLQINAQGICNPAGNLIIYSNYDGGDFTINIDENIPDIKIGLCSYEDFHVTITGAYAANVTQVWYAGYNSGGTTSVTGVDAGIVDILNYPPATFYDPDGNSNMVCAYECDTTYIPGGCNTVDQATDYFLTTLGGSIRYGYFQYGIFGGSYDMSEGGNCCVDAACAITIDAGQDQNICIGDSVQLAGAGATDYTWFPAGALSDFDIFNPYASPTTTTTYLLTGVDGDGCVGVDSMTVFVVPLPVPVVTVSEDTLFASGGVSYQWILDGVIIAGATGNSYVIEEDGVYSVIVTSADGCEQTSVEFLLVANSIFNNVNNFNIQLYPNPANDELIISVSGLKTIIYISVFNAFGQEIIKESAFITAEYVLNTSELPDGIYFLQYSDTRSNAIKEFLIQH